MIETSQELITRMRAEQTVSARINIASYKPQTMKQYSNMVEDYLTDTGIIEDTSEVEIYNIYKMPQLYNLRFNETGNYAVFEGDGIDMSGVQVVSKTNKTNQFGWWSSFLSDNNGYINPDVQDMPAILSWSLKQEKQNKLNIVFSKTRKEYAVNFDIEIDYLLPDGFTEKNIKYEIKGNNKEVYTLETLPDFSNFYENSGTITIKIYKWSKSNARPKICQLSLGEILEYTDDKIVSLNVTKGTSLTNENTESKEITLTIQDENEEYNIFNPIGSLASLNTNSALSLELGCVIDDFIYYVKTDEFNIEKPKKEQNSLEVTITGYGILKRFSDIDFSANYYEKDTAQLILDGILGYEEELFFNVDSTILNEAVQIRTEYGTVKVPEGINKIATAVRGNITETIDNKVMITRILEKEPVSIIKLENMINLPEIEKEKKPYTITINKYSPTSKGVTTIFEQQDVAIKEQLYIFRYSNEHTSAPYTAKFNCNEVESEYDLNCLFLENRAYFQGTKVDGETLYDIVGAGTVTISGNVIEIIETSSQFSVDPNGSENITINTESIESEEQAKSVFEWLKSNYNKCFKYKVEIQDAFTYEIGDTIELETGIYINGIMIKKKAIITNIEYEYKGALHYYLTLKGA